MKEIKPFIISLLIIASLFVAFERASAQTIFNVFRSILPETDSKFYLGTTTPSTRAWLSVITDQLCLTADTCRTTWPTGGSGTFSWTPTSYGVSTSTTLGFLNGFLSTASSTINSSFRLPTLSQGFAYIGTGGLVNTAATSTILSGYVPYTGATGAVNLGANDLTANQFIATGNSIKVYNNAGGFEFYSDAGVTQTGGIDSPIFGTYDFMGLNTGTLDFNSLSVGRNYVFPDLSGTFLLATGTQNFILGRGTTTSATTTNLFATTASTTNFSIGGGTLRIFGTVGTALSDFCTAITGGAGLCDGSDDGGAGASAFEIATTTDIAVSQLAYINKTTGRTTLSSVATGTVSATNGITVTAGRSAVGGALVIDCTVASGSAAGCLSTANWTTFNGKQDVFTAGDALTLTGTDIDFDGGTAPGGSLGGSWASPTIDDLFILNTGDTGTGDYTFDTPTFVLDSTGDEVGIGTTTPAYPLTVHAASEPQLALSAGAGVDQWIFRNAGGSLFMATSTYTATTSSNSITFAPATANSAGFLVGTTTDGSTGLAINGTVFFHGLTQATAGTNSDLCISATPNQVIEETTGTCIISSRKFKHDIKTLDISALDLISQLRTTSFIRNEDLSNKIHWGFIAEEAFETDEALAALGSQGEVRSLDDHGFLATLWKGIQELINWNNAQDERILELERQVTELQAIIKSNE